MVQLMVQPIVITLVSTRMALKVLRMGTEINFHLLCLNISLINSYRPYIHPFVIISFFPSILATSSSLGLNGNALSVTRLLGKLTVWRDPTLYIFTFASLTMYIRMYSNQYIKTYIHTIVYTEV